MLLRSLRFHAPSFTGYALPMSKQNFPFRIQKFGRGSCSFEFAMMCAVVSVLASACGGATTSTSSSAQSTTPAAATTAPPFDGMHQTLTPAQIRVEIGQHHAEVQACYNAALVRSPGHRGSVLVFFEIGPDGRVLRSNVLSNTSGDEPSGACLLAAVTAIRFPPTGHGILETRYSFDFREVDRDGDGVN